MALIPYEPFRQLDHFRREMNRVFSEGFPNLFDSFDPHNTPRVDVHENDREVIVTCDLPGLHSKEDVDIHIEHNMLTIRGTIQRQKELKEEHAHRVERFSGTFHRTITLPTRVNEDEVRATYKNGILEIRIPKQEETNRKKIDVEFH